MNLCVQVKRPWSTPEAGLPHASPVSGTTSFTRLQGLAWLGDSRTRNCRAGCSHGDPGLLFKFLHKVPVSEPGSECKNFNEWQSRQWRLPKRNSQSFRDDPGGQKKLSRSSFWGGDPKSEYLFKRSVPWTQEILNRGIG